jgi:hypothetical protein
VSARRSGGVAARAPLGPRGGRSGATLGEVAVGQRHAAEMLVGLVLLLGAAGGCWGLPGVRDHRQVARNVSRLLDDLLASDRYDKRIRPDFGGSRPNGVPLGLLSVRVLSPSPAIRLASVRTACAPRVSRRWSGGKLRLLVVW